MAALGYGSPVSKRSPVSRVKALLVLIVLLTAGWAQSAAAEVRVTFYSHGWGVGPRGETYFPHAFIRVEGQTAEGPPINETFGFTGTNLSRSMSNRPGVVVAADPRYLGASTAHFWLIITDDQYRALMAMIAWWKTPEGSTYNLRTRNCIHFTAEVARTLGLEPGTTRTWKPMEFMADTARRNGGRIAAVAGLAAPTDEARLSPDVEVFEKAAP